jgi:hypothetical protein
MSRAAKATTEAEFAHNWLHHDAVLDSVAVKPPGFKFLQDAGREIPRRKFAHWNL